MKRMEMVFDETDAREEVLQHVNDTFDKWAEADKPKPQPTVRDVAEAILDVLADAGVIARISMDEG